MFNMFRIRRKLVLPIALVGILLCIVNIVFATSSGSNSNALGLTTEMAVVICILIFAIALFIFEWVRVDVVGIIMMVFIPIVAYVMMLIQGSDKPFLSAADAISGLSSNAVVSIIAVIIIGAGLDKTGVINILARKVLSIAGKSESRIISVISGTVAIISSFMQNIGAAALFMPAAIRISKQVKIPVSRILMPMGFCAIVGGTITLVGASPTILLNELLVFDGKELEHFNLFEQTPIGLALAVSAILYFVIFGKFILPKKQGDDDSADLLPKSISDTYQEFSGIYELSVPEGFSDKRELKDFGLREKYGLTIVAIASKRRKNFHPSKYDTLKPGNDIAVIAFSDKIRNLANDFGFNLKDDLNVFAEDLSPNNAGMIEGIITPRSDLVGKRMIDFNFRKTYEVNPIVLSRQGGSIFSDLSKTKVNVGDAFLLFGRWEKFHFLKNQDTFTFTTDIKGDVVRTEKAPLAFAWLVIALILVMATDIKLSIALLTGALGMIVTKVMSVDEAYKSVDWMTVFLLAGLIPLGKAFAETGAAGYIANNIMSIIGAVSPIIFLLVIGLMTSFFTLVVSNVGATVLLVPLAISMAVKAGVDPRMAALVVALSASNTFIIPTHQVNALVMRPGGYRTIDYVKAGSGMTIIFLVVMVGMLYLFY